MTTTPYYEQDGLTIYCEDANQVLATMPNRSVDIVLTDPPYGIQYVSGWYAGYNPHGSIRGDDKYPTSALRHMFRIARAAVFSFCRWDQLAELPKPASFIAWVKNNHSAGNLNHEYGRKWEGCCFWPLEEHQFTSRPPDVIECRRVSKLLHPTQKPVYVMRHILEHNAGDVILDPFMGSGTTLVAAKDLGRKAVGIEIDERYCEIAANRLRQSLLPNFVNQN